MLKNMKKSTKSNVITLGIVVGFYVLIQILSAAGALTNSFSGQLVPICAYVIMAVSLNLTVGMLEMCIRDSRSNRPGPRFRLLS